MAEKLSNEESKRVLLQIESDLFKPIRKHDYVSQIWLVFLVSLIILGLYAWIIQLRDGLTVTGLRDYTSWGMYIGNFVFFVAVSLIGSLISSILHLLNVKWITPVSRIAEQIAVAAVLLAGIVIVMDMGRPERAPFVLMYGRFASPILWDITVVITYLTISVLLIFLPLIPDIAMLRNKMTDAPKWQQTIYKILSLGWNGTEEQYKTMKKAIRILLILIIPVALSIHTVTSWLFAATLRPGWDSTIFGPYFVSGAFVAGVAGVLILMYVYRKRYDLQNYLTDKHFDLVCKLLVLVSLVYLYFNINEFLVPAYKMKTLEGAHITELFNGSFSLLFYLVQLGGLILPIILLLFKKMRKPMPAFFIGIAVLVAAWFKRYLIVVPTMSHTYLPIQNVPDNFIHYQPTGIEIFVTLLPVAAGLLIITFLAKMFPVITIWEYAEEKGVNRDDLLK